MKDVTKKYSCDCCGSRALYKGNTYDGNYGKFCLDCWKALGQGIGYHLVPDYQKSKLAEVWPK